MRIDLLVAEQIPKCLCEGNSVRATARLTNTDQHTVIDLMNMIGGRCPLATRIPRFATSRSRISRSMKFGRFIFCKQKPPGYAISATRLATQYLFTAIERNTKLLVTWHFGKRDQWNTDYFCA